MAVLLALPGKQLSLRELINWVWTEDEEEPLNIQRTFHTYANRIRTEVIGKLDNVQLVAVNGTFRLVLDRMQIDYHRFRRLIDRARDVAALGDRVRARELVLHAMELWQGPPLAELQTEHADSWRRNATNNHWIPANSLLVKLHLELGEPERAIGVLDDVQDEFPNNIMLGKDRFVVLSRLGRRSDGEECIRSLRGALRSRGDDEGADDLLRFQKAVWRNGQRPAPTRSERDRPARIVALPHAVADFVGRGRLLSQLDAAAVDGNGRLRATVVCLVGASGVGKTAVATHWARRRHDEHGDEAILVDLRGFGDSPMLTPAAVIDELLRQLGFPVQRIDTESGRAGKVRELLTDRRMTVVLDNARDSLHVRPLLPALSSSLVVITTRRRLTTLASAGAANLTVPLLDPDSAAELLARRIGDRAGADPDSVARLAARCGGLPIVLTLVGHQVAGAQTAIGDFVARFGDPAVLLALGSDGDGADSSPGAAFAASYQALAAPEQRMFRLLGLHPGPDIDVSAAAALAGLPAPRCRALLVGLTAIHLVEQGPVLDRWRLHDLFHAFAADLAEQEDPEADRRAAHRRLLDFYLHSAHRADRQVFAYRRAAPIPAQPRDTQPMEFADEQAAVGWCVAERANLVAAANLAAERGFTEHCLWLPHAVDSCFKRLGFRAELRVALERAIDAARDLGDAPAEAATLNDAGLLALEAGDLDVARAHFRRAELLANGLRSAQGRATSLCNLARLEIAENRPTSGIEHYQRALEVVDDSGEIYTRATVNRRLAEAYRDQRMFDAAIMHYHRALSALESIGHRYGKMESLTGLAIVYLRRDVRRNDFGVARGFAERAVLLAVAGSGDVEIEQRARLVYAEALLHVREHDLAVEQAGRAVQLARQAHRPDNEAAALHLFAHALRATGRPADAADVWRQCGEICRDRNDAQRLAIVELRLAELADGDADVPAARTPPAPLPAPRATR